MRLSKIFTNGELRAIELREQGDKCDKTGVFSRRVRPKINEILLMNLQRLEDLIKR